MGNIVNRVFDSSGPEGKVRGTPQQIIDKYNQLARDAQLGNDRVAAENFQQHAEHYTRLLGEALREQEQQRAQQQERQPDRRDDDRDDGRQQRSGGDDRGGDQPQSSPRADGNKGGRSRQDDVIDVEEDASGGLVETPESAPQKPKRSRRKKAETAQDGSSPSASSDTPEAAE